MVNRIREILRGPAGTAIAGVVLLVGLALAYFTLFGANGESEAIDASKTRVYIDSTTDKPFSHTVEIGDTLPVKAPSGGETGYPAELCYWTADGKIKEVPFPVLVAESMGKSGPTFCRDCGRLVVPHNPRPFAGATAPPLKSEYKGTVTPSR